MSIASCSIFAFDAGECAKATLLGWVPDWLWETFGFIHDYWQWIAYGLIALAVLRTLYQVYKVFGTPGVIAVFGAAMCLISFVLGRRTEAKLIPHPDSGQPSVRFPGTAKPVVIKKPGHLFPADPPPTLTH